MICQVLDNTEDLNSTEHTFLDYKHVDAHFIYGFLWKTTPSINRNVLFSGLPTGKRGESQEYGGWISPLLHERCIGKQGRNTIESSWIGAYQPTFIMGHRCLEKTGYVENGCKGHPLLARLIVPLSDGVALPHKGRTIRALVENRNIAIHPVRISWTIRLFASGTGTFTIRISLSDLSKVSKRSDRFVQIHHLLRLIPNVDIAPELHPAHSIPQNTSLTDAFLFTPAHGTCRLFDIMRYFRDSALQSIPRCLLFKSTDKSAKPSLFAEETGLAYPNGSERTFQQGSQHSAIVRSYNRYHEKCWNENQSPFLFLTTVLGQHSLESLGEPSVLHAKEFGSIYAKLTLDNRYADKDFVHFTEDYLERALHFDKNRELLPNFSHHAGLFFSFCRRGSIVATESPDEQPALFVIPSLLNLFEIIRSRLFAGLAIGARLTELAHRLAALDLGSDPIDPAEYARLRSLVVANLENPLEYIFDGGSATEMALCAEEALLVRRVWEDVRRSFDLVDRLMAAWDSERFRKEYGV